MSRDMMGAFELYQPDTVEGAVDLLGRFGEEGWALAGGNEWDARIAHIDEV